MATDVTILYGTSEVPLYSVLLNKKHFNPIGGHFLRISSICFQRRDPIGSRKWPPMGLKCFLFNNTEDTGTSEGPYTIVTSMAMG